MFQSQKDLMHHRHQNLHNLIGRAMNILQSTSICLRTQHRIRCHHNHHCRYLPTAYDCMGIGLEHLLLLHLELLHYSSQAHGCHHMSLYQYPMLVSNLLDIYHLGFHHQPIRPGHHHHNQIGPTKILHRHSHSRH